MISPDAASRSRLTEGAASRSRLPAAAAIACTAWLIALAFGWPISVSGDAQGVYFLPAQGLWNGDGISAFASLYYGPGRMPGISIAIALAAVFTEDLTRAAQIANVSMAALMIYLSADLGRLLKLPAPAIAGAALTIATSAVFVMSSLEALPDLGCALCTLVLVRLLLAETSRPFAIGLAAGISFLFRFNALALIAIAPVCAAMIAAPGSKRRAAGFAILGAAVACLPIAIIGLGLKNFGISYPNIYIESQNIAATEKVSTIVVLGAALRGLAETPKRLFDAFGVLAAGALLMLWAWREKRLRAPLSAVIAMGALITPIHYEARYYLFLLPPAALAVFAAASRSKWVIAGLCVWITAFNVRAVLHQRESVQLAAREIFATCEAIAGEALVGIDPELYRYSHLKHCPSARRSPSKVALTPAAFGDPGTPVWVGKDGLRRAPQGETATARGPNLLSQTWKLDLPKRPGRACELTTLDTPNGAQLLTAELGSRPPLVAELMVETSSGAVRLRAAGLEPTRVSAPVTLNEKTTFRLCAADPLRAAGEVFVEKIELVTPARYER